MMLKTSLFFAKAGGGWQLPEVFESLSCLFNLMWKFKAFIVGFCLWGMAGTAVQAEEFMIKTSDIDAVSHEIDFEMIDKIAHASVYLIETDATEERLKQVESIETFEKNETIQLPISDQKFHALQMSEDWGFTFLRLSSLAYGNRIVKVGLLDTGVDMDHPLLVPYLEDGYTMYPHEGVDDLNGHGTGIAGIIVNQSPTTIRLVPIKVMNQYGRASSYSIVDGLYTAIEAKVDVVNLSLGAIYTSLILEEAIQEAFDANITIVAAAGNYGGEGALYPARYTNVIGVGALNENGLVADFSQRGEGIDVYVPGTNLVTTSTDGGWSIESGTSFASGYVSKATAFLKTHRNDSNRELLADFERSLTFRDPIYQLSVPRLNYQALSFEEEHIQKQLPSVVIKDLQKQWTIDFSQDVSTVSISPRSIYIKGNNEIIESVVSVRGNAVTIKPIEPLIPGNTYVLIVSSYVTSSYGEALEESVLKRFKVDPNDKK